MSKVEELAKGIADLSSAGLRALGDQLIKLAQEKEQSEQRLEARMRHIAKEEVAAGLNGRTPTGTAPSSPIPKSDEDIRAHNQTRQVIVGNKLNVTGASRWRQSCKYPLLTPEQVQEALTTCFPRVQVLLALTLGCFQNPALIYQAKISDVSLAQQTINGAPFPMILLPKVAAAIDGRPVDEPLFLVHRRGGPKEMYDDVSYYRLSVALTRRLGQKPVGVLTPTRWSLFGVNYYGGVLTRDEIIHLTSWSDTDLNLWLKVEPLTCERGRPLMWQAYDQAAENLLGPVFNDDAAAGSKKAPVGAKPTGA